MNGKEFLERTIKVDWALKRVPVKKRR